MNNLKNNLQGIFLITLLLCSTQSWLQDSPGHLYFDGVNDYVKTQNTRLDYVNDDFTFEAIIKGNEDEQGVNPTIISNRWSHIKGSAFYLKDMGDQPRALCFSNRGEEWYLPNNGSLGSLLDGECHHVAITRNDGDIFFYADGLLFGMIHDPTCANNLQGFNPIRIGSDHVYGNEFKGVIGKVRFWDIVRTGTEIAENMNTSLTGSESGLKACWELNEGSGQYIYDKISGTWSSWGGFAIYEDIHDPDWFPGDYCADIADYGTGDDDGMIEEVTGEVNIEEDENDGDVEDEHTAGVGNNTLGEDISIFPNPSSTGILTIDFGTEQENVELILTNLNGQEIIKTSTSEKTSFTQLNVGDLAEGTYLLIIQNDQGRFTEKIVFN